MQKRREPEFPKFSRWQISLNHPFTYPGSHTAHHACLSATNVETNWCLMRHVQFTSSVNSSSLFVAIWSDLKWETVTQRDGQVKVVLSYWQVEASCCKLRQVEGGFAQNNHSVSLQPLSIWHKQNFWLGFLPGYTCIQVYTAVNYISM